MDDTQDTEKRRIASPDGRFEARLRADGRTAWKMTRVRLCLAGLSFSDREFGWRGVWSDCSRYFAIMEWRRSGSLAVPESRLVLVDLRDAKECVVDHARRGFIEPLRMFHGRIRYIRIDRAKNEQEIRERSIGDVTSWTPVSDVWTDVLRPDRDSAAGVPAIKGWARSRV